MNEYLQHCRPAAMPDGAEAPVFAEDLNAVYAVQVSAA